MLSSEQLDFFDKAIIPSNRANSVAHISSCCLLAFPSSDCTRYLSIAANFSPFTLLIDRRQDPMQTVHLH